GPAHRLRDLDSHDAEIEALVDELAGDLGLLVHLGHERTHLGLGEVPYLLAEHPLVLGEVGEREAAGGSEGLGHRITSTEVPCYRREGSRSEPLKRLTGCGFVL